MKSKCPTCNDEKEVVQDVVGILAWGIAIGTTVSLALLLVL